MRDARRLVHAFLVLSFAVLVSGCTQSVFDGGEDVGNSGQSGGGGGGSDPGRSGTGGTGPGEGSGDQGLAADLVDAIGTEHAVDIAAWNIENFPADANTPALVADLINSLGIDLVAVEEIANLEAFQELVDLLPDHEGLLSFHEYSPGNFQKVGYIFRADLMDVDPQDLLFEDDPFQFPRPPFQVQITVNDAAGGPIEFVAIVLHLKAGTGTEDRERRRQAMVTLEAHVRGLVASGAEKVVLLGDYNEILTSASGRDVFAPFLDAPDLYRVETDELAQSGAFSFVPTELMLDHLVTTVALDDELHPTEPVIPRLDLQIDDYVDRVSDHLPVAIALPILP